MIAGSVGPYGAILCNGSEYNGAYVQSMSLPVSCATIDHKILFIKERVVFKELIEWHRPRIDALLEAGVDLLAFETIPSIKEATALCSILADYPLAEAWLSFSCKVRTDN